MGLGIPDVSYSINSVNGWIELKHTHVFPKRETTPVRMKRFTEDQRLFLYERGSAGGYCWLLWQVEQEYYLFDHCVVWELGNVPRNRLEEIAFRHWHARINKQEFIEAIQVRRECSNYPQESGCVFYGGEVV